ncbi:hypothetical protein GCM10009785_00110 [Brooklawnia cerclae]
MLAVVVQMAPLAHGAQVVVVAVLRRVVEVSNRQDDARPRPEGGLTVAIAASAVGIQMVTGTPTLSRALTPQLGPLDADAMADRLPVARIAAEILRADRAHVSAPLMTPTVRAYLAADSSAAA